MANYYGNRSAIILECPHCQKQGDHHSGARRAHSVSRTLFQAAGAAFAAPILRLACCLIATLVCSGAVVPIAAAQEVASPFAPSPGGQGEALRKYPALGIAGSAFNRAFLERVRAARQERPELFATPDWAVTLAAEVAQVVPASLPQPPPPNVNAIRLEGATAVAPANAPAEVQRAISAGNALQTRGYKLGGGRDSLEDWGYDCSGTVSYVLVKAGLLDEPRTSRSFASFGEPGPGRWITVFTAPGHVFMTICGLRLDTGGRGGQGTPGPRWNVYPRLADGYVVRHPPGL